MTVLRGVVAPGLATYCNGGLESSCRLDINTHKHSK